MEEYYFHLAEEFEKVEKPQSDKIGIQDFSLLSVIGKGSYAKVLLVKKKDTQEFGAMKVIKKSQLKQKSQLENVKLEREILSEMDFPFIVKLKYAFQNREKIYFVLEYCCGGELFYLLQKKQRLRMQQAKFYAAQLILALEYLHKKSIIYRDLKPENVLISSDGYLKLTDFGLSSCKGYPKRNGLCGTLEYMAPESAIIFEMVMGYPPFFADSKEELFQQILEKEVDLCGEEQFCSIVRKLLIKKPEKRLGRQGAGEVKSHPWFLGIDWEKLKNKGYPAPFVPSVTHEADVNNFAPEFTEIAIQSITSTKGIHSPVEMNIEGFSYPKQSSQVQESIQQEEESKVSFVQGGPKLIYKEMQNYQFIVKSNGEIEGGIEEEMAPQGVQLDGDEELIDYETGVVL